MSTIGETIANAICAADEGPGSCPISSDEAAATCAALGVDPSTPLANLVALQPGQYVVEMRRPGAHDRWLWNARTVCVGSSQYAHPVVVREAVPVPTGDAWEGETCDDCGGRYERTIWTAPDELWHQLVGKPSGLLCPSCFDDRAKAAGLFLRWIPRVEPRGAVSVRAENGEQP